MEILALVLAAFKTMMAFSTRKPRKHAFGRFQNRSKPKCRSLLTPRNCLPQRLGEFDTFHRGPEGSLWVPFGVRRNPLRNRESAKLKKPTICW
jgi:hypothetical protein